MASAGAGSTLSYSNKMILAPMVRAGRLPLRLVALRYGADLVYSEEHVDHKILTCRRVENSLLNTTDFISPDGKCQFRTCQEERDSVVFQMNFEIVCSYHPDMHICDGDRYIQPPVVSQITNMREDGSLRLGTADAERALKTARMVENDVAGIDINMGCPKDFSIKGGMGASLLTNPDRVRDILTTLVQGLRKPVTCKIRLLPSREDTLRLAKVIEGTGVSAMAVHGRYKTERPEQPCHGDLIREVAQSVSIPIIANGGSLNIFKYDDIMAFKEETGCSSVMVARAALQNPSIFRHGDPLPIEEVATEFVRTCLHVDETMSLVKYCLSIMLKPFAKLNCPNITWAAIAHKTSSATSLLDMSSCYNLQDQYQVLLAERDKTARSLPLHQQKELDTSLFSSLPAKRSLVVEKTKDGVHEMHVKYDKHTFPHSAGHPPKMLLLEYAKSMKYPPPTFLVTEEKQSRVFKAVVTFNKKKYSSSIMSVNKKGAEHSAALVVLTHCGVISKLQAKRS